MVAIDNLNKVVREREKMIHTIIDRKRNPRNDAEYDKLWRRYSGYGFQQLVRLSDKYDRTTQG